MPPPVHPSPFPSTPVTTHLGPVFEILPFPERTVIKTIQSAASSDGPLLLRSMNGKLLQVLSWLDSSFPFSAEYIPFSGGTTVCLCFTPKHILAAQWFGKLGIQGLYRCEIV